MAEEKKEKKNVVPKRPKYFMTRFDVEIPISYSLLTSNVSGLPKSILLLGDQHTADPVSTLKNADMVLEHFLTLFDKDNTFFVLEKQPPLDEKKSLSPPEKYIYEKKTDYIDRMKYHPWAKGKHIELIDQRSNFIMPQGICINLLSVQVGPDKLEESSARVELLRHYYDQTRNIPLYEEWNHLVRRVKKCKTSHGLRSIIFRLLRQVRTRHLQQASQIKKMYEFASYNYNIQKKFWNKEYKFDPIQETKKFLVKRDEYNYAYYGEKKDSRYLYTCAMKKIYTLDTKTSQINLVVDMSDDRDFFNSAGFLFYPGATIILNMYRPYHNPTHFYLLTKEDIVRVDYAENTFSDFDGRIHFINRNIVVEEHKQGTMNYPVEFFRSINKNTGYMPDVKLPRANCLIQHAINNFLLDAAFLAILCDVQEKYKNIVLYTGANHEGHIAYQLINSGLYSLISSEYESNFQISFDEKAIEYLVNDMGVNWKELFNAKVGGMSRLYDQLVHVFDDKKIDINDKLELTIRTVKLHFISKEDVLRYTKWGCFFAQKWRDLISAHRDDIMKGDPAKRKKLEELLRYIGV